ncbi:hypothetical protein B5S28_g1561 [[Candida] boidinii]|uniref:Unnamed protein product n=1 Tax=Candida boidinii TaxID=5477 RepID=A0ACB5TPS0_CANBO|nr:hypothetical protein B5S28_g1561 [[Candida] boidinii]OWB61136.1 hypothetical protein B5S29_g2020 [[Candida] boidinii]OWB73091.1 hypothetical protein B5S31_g2823 [[Candida] boidinii]OWB76578.1 hypothetical protein B5S32_g731 [[Candida] boidinii]GME92925.1 unnamed protein product [[Candida] boidinii]
MSFDIDWESITSDESISRWLTNFLNERLASISLPSYLSDLKIVKCSLGERSPEITIRDINYPFEEFYQHEDGKDIRSSERNSEQGFTNNMSSDEGIDDEQELRSYSYDNRRNGRSNSLSNNSNSNSNGTTTRPNHNGGSSIKRDTLPRFELSRSPSPATVMSGINPTNKFQQNSSLHNNRPQTLLSTGGLFSSVGIGGLAQSMNSNSTVSMNGTTTDSKKIEINSHPMTAADNNYSIDGITDYYHGSDSKNINEMVNGDGNISINGNNNNNNNSNSSLMNRRYNNESINNNSLNGGNRNYNENNKLVSNNHYHNNNTTEQFSENINHSASNYINSYQTYYNALQNNLQQQIAYDKTMKSRDNDIQFIVDLKFDGDIYIEVTCNLLVNFPAPDFIILPVRLKVSDLYIHSLAVIAYLDKKVFLSFLCDVDDGESREVSQSYSHQGHYEQDLSGRENSRTNFTASNVSSEPQSFASRERIDIVRRLRIQGELGNYEGNHIEDHGSILRNISKIEKFLTGTIRSLLVVELAWPSWIELDFNEYSDDEDDGDNDQVDDDNEKNTAESSK